MGESTLGLPTDGAGKQLRVELGDGTTNQIPSGVYEEVVVVSDAQGLFDGDGRRQPRPVTEQTMQEVLIELRRQTLLLSIAFGSEIPSLGDAMNLGG